MAIRVCFVQILSVFLLYDKKMQSDFNILYAGMLLEPLTLFFKYKHTTLNGNKGVFWANLKGICSKTKRFETVISHKYRLFNIISYIITMNM